jgi:hypothetical protein
VFVCFQHQFMLPLNFFIADTVLEEAPPKGVGTPSLIQQRIASLIHKSRVGSPATTRSPLLASRRVFDPDVAKLAGPSKPRSNSISSVVVLGEPGGVSTPRASVVINPDSVLGSG